MRTRLLLAVLMFLGPISAQADFAAGLAAYDGGDYQAAYREWLPLARNGDTEAQAAIADLFLRGYGVARDAAAAAQWYRRAARQGDVLAQMNLADLYAQGLGLEKDLIRAYAWIHLAAEAGHPWAQRRRTAIGYFLTDGQIRRAIALSTSLISAP